MGTSDSEKKGGSAKALFMLKVLEIRMRFVAILIVTALLVGYWDVVMNYWQRWMRGPREMAHITSAIEYTCAMHPFVARDVPGKCPICGMDLIQRKKGALTKLPEGVIARVQLSPERIVQGGIEVESVAYRVLARTVRTYGLVESDETRVARITLRFPGRVDELMVNAVGAVVKKGDPLASIYSPKFLAASQEFTQALASKRQGDIDALTSAETKQFAATIVVATRKRLELAGLTSEQLEELERTGKPADHITFYSPLAGTVLEKNVLLGDTMEEGSTLYTVADLSHLWVQVQIPEPDLAIVKQGMPVEITAVTWPGKIFPGNVELIYPTLNAENRSVKARVSANNTDGKLKPGMFVNAVIRAPLGQYGEVAANAEPTIENISNASNAATDDVYTCTMHPEVISDKPGNCPKCGMTLVKKTPEAAASATSKQQWIEGFTCPMHPDTLEKPGATICTVCGCGMKLLKWRIEQILSVSETAVVDTGTRQIVYVESQPGVFDARAITLGPRAGPYFQVLDGLGLGDRVAARGSFLIDAEARLNPAATPQPDTGAPVERKP